MIGRKSQRGQVASTLEPRGFDDYDLRLGDVMRGERATLGKSLLDVQRELRIKASYIAAIENCDPTAFDTPGFIAGYVRSYARYLGMDPDRAFAQFCAESGFSTAHGMSAAASVVRKSPAVAVAVERDPFSAPTTPFAPAREALLSRIEPGAIGSALVLLVLIGSIGFGGWTVLNEVQRVKFAPVENTPNVLADLDPLESVRPLDDSAQSAGVALTATPEALDRLYRPEPLDVPVLVARDAPISTLDPGSVGLFADAQLPEAAPNAGELAGASATQLPQVVETLGPGVTIVAARASWVRVRAADGSTVFEGIMEPCDTYKVAQTEQPYTLRVGESGAIYFAVDGQAFGPAGSRGQVTSNLALSAENLLASYQPADMGADADLSKVFADLSGSAPEPFCNKPVLQ